MNTKISQDLGWLSSIVPAISRQKSNQLRSGEHKRHSNSAHAMGMPRWWVTRCRPASWMRLRPQTIQIRYSSSVISAILGAVLGYLVGRLAGLLKPRLGRWVHKTTNVLNKVALSVQVNMKADLREIYGAPTRAAAEAAIDVFADKYGAMPRTVRKTAMASPNGRSAGHPEEARWLSLGKVLPVGRTL